MATENFGDPEDPPRESADRLAASAKCKVCRGVPASLFYGVKACRVCKGIFKRGVKKKFHCQFDAACDVKGQMKDRCKACVFSKCVRKGMVAQDTGVPGVKETAPAKTKSAKPVKAAKKDSAAPADFKPARPVAVVDRYYEVKEDLRSLFQPSESAKPFRFFDNDDQGAEADEFAASSGFEKRPAVAGNENYYRNDDDDQVDDQALPATATATAVQAPPGQTFFFSVNDPRLAEGTRFMTLDDTERAAGLEEWKKKRPQIAADFKKLKKNANRKRKTFDR